MYLTWLTCNKRAEFDVTHKSWATSEYQHLLPAAHVVRESTWCDSSCITRFAKLCLLIMPFLSRFFPCASISLASLTLYFFLSVSLLHLSAFHYLLPLFFSYCFPQDKRAGLQFSAHLPEISRTGFWVNIHRIKYTVTILWTVWSHPAETRKDIAS